ncbi:hypothetical protein PF005_g11096 [Phytophthora fragariae]|uniref:Uncharacterized protein n=1 Tax=Phytophthora fragariae TaxID=53985 RepID=A0A6A3SA85_9STRA|nr:hypothetical protein PF007_g10877 [Phytophthora fragariae]KAE9211174.1 hypothetical protein PF005_g11096 [Phytophthora fragariae]
MLFSSAPALCTPRSVRTAVLAAKFAARNAGAGDTLLVHLLTVVHLVQRHQARFCSPSARRNRLHRLREGSFRRVLPVSSWSVGRSHRSSPQLPRVKERSRGQLRYPPFLLI